MTSEPIFLTVDEASSLKAAVESIVAAGIQVPVAEYQTPAANVEADGVDAPSGEKPEGFPEGGL
jgi:hypothetical protein